jgi:hypothetical protein
MFLSHPLDLLVCDWSRLAEGSAVSALNWLELQVAHAAVVEHVVPSVVSIKTASIITLNGRHFTMFLVSLRCRDALGGSRVVVNYVVNASVAVGVAKPGAAQTAPVVVSVEGRGAVGASALLTFAAARSSKVVLTSQRCPHLGALPCEPIFLVLRTLQCFIATQLQNFWSVCSTTTWLLLLLPVVSMQTISWLNASALSFLPPRLRLFVFDPAPLEPCAIAAMPFSLLPRHLSCCLRRCLFSVCTQGLQCTVSVSCNSFRSGSVCAVPDRVAQTVRVSDVLLLCSFSVSDADADVHVRVKSAEGF